jgi:hypothetical protein
VSVDVIASSPGWVTAIGLGTSRGAGVEVRSKSAFVSGIGTTPSSTTRMTSLVFMSTTTSSPARPRTHPLRTPRTSRQLPWPTRRPRCSSVPK